VKAFAENYEEARETFLAAAETAGFRQLRFRVPHEDSSELFLDFALLRRDPKRVLLHLSGVHGIEGFAGSAVQTELLGDSHAEEGPSLLFVHGLNPYGMKFYRRANGQNVDLNRNFRKGAARPNPDYALFDGYLNPASLNSFRSDRYRAIWKALRLGWARAAKGIASGQATHPKGLFYMGDRVQREIQLLQDILRHHCGQAEELTALDFHTGLGRYKQEQLFVDFDAEPNAETYVRETFGRAPDQPKDLTYIAQGRLSDAIRETLPQTKIHYVLQEMGARSQLKTLDALRLENYEWHRRPAGSDRPVEVVRAMMDAFCPEDPSWRGAIVAAGAERWRQAERALAALPR